MTIISKDDNFSISAHNSNFTELYNMAIAKRSECPFRIGDINISSYGNPSSIYTSTTWIRLDDVFLRGVPYQSEVSTVTGSNSHVLIEDVDMPPHGHSVSIIGDGGHGHSVTCTDSGGHLHTLDSMTTTSNHQHTIVANDGQKYGYDFSTLTNRLKDESFGNGDSLHSHSFLTASSSGHDHPMWIGESGSHTHTTTNRGTGSSTPFNTKPAHMNVEMWQRIS